MPSGGDSESGSEKGNLDSSGTVSAKPIGVNVPITSPQATAAADQVTQFRLRTTIQEPTIALIKTRAFVGAAMSQNTLET